MPSSPQDDLTSVITWYDVLGVLPDAPREDIREAWQARTEALQPGLLAGAPPDVLSAADEARQAVQEAWRVLADPAARESYDEQIGFVRPGEGLDPSRRGPGSSAARGTARAPPRRARWPPTPPGAAPRRTRPPWPGTASGR